MKKLIFLVIVLIATLPSCAIADLKTDDLAAGNISTQAESKGRKLLEDAMIKMGYDQFQQTSTYEVKANFDWSTLWSMMPMNSLPKTKNKDILFRFATNTFDGQLEFLEGKHLGDVYGLQSWEAYRSKAEEKDVSPLNSKRYPWGLATYHYLIEAPFRLLEANVIRYAGQTTFLGKGYDLVYVTWGNGEQKKDYDQWLVYINQETGFIDLTELTITDFFLPMPNGMKNATVQFPSRTKTTIGTYLPSTVVIQLGRPKEKLTNDVYTFTLRDYRFDSFPKSVVYPLEGLMFYGDSKPVK